MLLFGIKQWLSNSKLASPKPTLPNPLAPRDDTDCMTDGMTCMILA